MSTRRPMAYQTHDPRHCSWCRANAIADVVGPLLAILALAGLLFIVLPLIPGAPR